MARNWIRTCSLTLSGSSTKTVSGGGQTDLRIVFSVKQWSLPSPNMASFRIYNPSPSTQAKLKANEFTDLKFDAGYQDHVGTIFQGSIKQTISGHETAVDSYVDIFCADGEKSYNQARVTKTLAAGYTPQDKFDAAMESFKPFGVTLGLNKLDLSQPKYPRGIPLIGMARDIIREVTMSAGGVWSIQQGQVKAVPKTLETGDSGVVIMNGHTGMLGWPQQTTEGIVVRSLLNPNLQPLAKIKIDPSAILQAERDNDPSSANKPVSDAAFEAQNVGAGTYTIFHLDRMGDTRGGRLDGHLYLHRRGWLSSSFSGKSRL